MSRRCVALLFGAVLLAGHAEAAEPFSMRGIQLGITLEQFRSTPAPENPSFVNIKPVCSNDTGQENDFVIDDAAKGLGEQVCRWDGDISIQPFPHAPPTHLQASVQLGDSFGFPEFRFFPSGGQLRLRQIFVSSRMIYWDELVSAYKEKYGPPEISTGSVENGYGATFPQIVEKWGNDSSTIVIESRCNRIDYVCVTYTDDSLEDAYTNALRRAKGDPADKL